ncbi:MCE family protein [Paraconexibacter antarcticus]|uniref:MCE family protein n=1 Tax=Paraconexibacter antarcticus TaxID=2949664 RepID=A0ABY5DTR6_9ACTN|nr:MlaD family protein [Paraconexibacter antarcticus]UTI65420.1 MCE family protein [Paraconexibacter antarcticus]
MQGKVLAMVLGFVALGAAIVLLGGDHHKYTIRAELSDAGGLRKNSSVKIAGVPAGKVRDITVTKDDHAIATLEIDDSAKPIGQGAKVNIRPTDLLGERYAEIQGGDPAKPMPSGALVPISKTAEPVELDDILNMLDADTRTRLGILINEVGVGLEGRGADFNKLLAQLPPSLDDTAKLLKQIRGQNAALKVGVQRADAVTALVNGRREDMGKLIRQASHALDVVAQKRTQLASTIQNAPGALANLRSTLANLDRASVQLKPAAADLQRTTGPLKATLAAIPAFTQAARPTLQKATDVSPDITRLATGALPTVKRLRPTLQKAAAQLVLSAPILKELDRRGYDDLLLGVDSLQKGTKARDGVGHFIGAHLDIGADYVQEAVNVLAPPQGAITPATRKKQAAPAAVAPSTQPQAATPTPLDAPTKKLGDILNKIVPGLGDTTNKVTKGVQDTIGGATGGLKQALPGLSGGKSGGIPGLAPPPPANKSSDALRLFDYLMGQ